ncbi:MAG: CRTAC1 family protein [Acidobacteriota bacterium]|nr:CRTAC1 family protein [Acidobacteriota bacterium]
MASTGLRHSDAVRCILLLLVAQAGHSMSTLAQIPYTEEAVARGIDYLVEQGDWGSGYGSGVAFADLDGDGDPDVVVTGDVFGNVALYENDGTGQFTDRSSTSGIARFESPSGVVVGDYDGDQDLDLYFTQWEHPNALYENVGGFQFVDVTSTAQVGDDGAGMGAAFGDYDGDGWLDLYVANRTLPAGDPQFPPNRMYHNLGNGQFEEVGATLGVDDAGSSFQGVFFDYDLDGRLDLYVSTDKGTTVFTNRLYRNLGGTFEDVSASSGADAIGDLMGVGIGDFDRNGYPDIYTTNIPVGNFLLLNQGDGTFIDGTAAAGVGAFATGWATHFLDIENDGDEDLFVANNAPNMLFRYGGSFPVPEIAAAMGLADAGNAFCAAIADIEGDGDLDILIQNLGGKIQLYVNHNNDAADGSHNWFAVTLTGSGGNLHAVGARIDIEAGGQRQSRQVFAGIGYKSSSSLVQHFGLGSLTTVDRMVVTWPGGAQTSMVGLPANQRYALTRASNPAGAVGGDPGGQVLVAKEGDGTLSLNWGPSCLGTDDDYAVYAGDLDAMGTHEPLACTTTGNSSHIVDPVPGDRYYLVVPTNGVVEGSYGRAGDGDERLQGTSACMPQSIGACGG